jgi:putative ABC transport system substrate-binding protein
MRPAVASGRDDPVIDRRIFICTTILGLVGAPLATEAQQAEKARKIGVLALGSPNDAGSMRAQQVFADGLRERGWIEGQTIVLERRWAEGRHERFPEFAAELIRLNADLIVAWVSAAALAAQKATKTIPIVMVQVSDPVGLGLVKSLAKPGGNITGLAFVPGLEIYGKQVELLKELVPNLASLGLVWNPRNPFHRLAVREVEAAAQTLAIHVQSLRVGEPEGLQGAFDLIAYRQGPAALVLADGLFYIHRARLVELAAERRLPSIYTGRASVESGGLISYGPNEGERPRLAADYVDRILRGANPAELPIEQPTKFELVINLKTAKALGLTIPQSVLVRADEVIE